MNKQKKFVTRSSTLKVHIANSQTISLYPVRFSKDIFFSSLVFFTFCLLVIFGCFCEIKSITIITLLLYYYCYYYFYYYYYYYLYWFIYNLQLKIAFTKSKQIKFNYKRHQWRILCMKWKGNSWKLPRQLNFEELYSVNK